MEGEQGTPYSSAALLMAMPLWTASQALPSLLSSQFLYLSGHPNLLLEEVDA